MITHALGYCGYVADEWEYEHEAFEVGNSPVGKGVAQPLFEEAFKELLDKGVEITTILVPSAPKSYLKDSLA